MKKLLLKSAMLCAVGLAGHLSFAQNRYVDDVFSGVTKTANIEYDSNRSVNILYGVVQGQLPIITGKLMCDIYQPEGDSIEKRPLIIVASTGSFLPAIVNQQATGNKDDSAIVELCTRFAKKGYVAVALNYRVGWNPQETVSEVATEQLLKATYRALQDVRNCIRYMRVNATEYGVDTSKIVVGGQGTGGYIALAFGTVDRRAEIEENIKFLRGGDLSPMVSVDTLGDWNGLGGVALPAYPFYFNYSGDSAVSGDAHMIFNYGGAMGDSAWLEASSLPMVGMHVTTDIFAPYHSGNVVVPGTNRTVIPNASGAGDVIPRANALGVNDKINAAVYNDPYTARAMAVSGGVKNLFPFQTQVSVDGAPWEWWDRPTVQAKVSGSFYGMPIPASGAKADSLSSVTNPFMSATKARAYIDTVVNFIAPRIAVQFDLVDFTGIKELANLSSKLSVFPNPAKEELNIQLPVNMKSVSIVDMMGREVLTSEAKSMNAKMDISSLTQGLYFVNVKTVDGRNAVKRVVVQ
jgi:acetyl esterase/lipase